MIKEPIRPELKVSITSMYRMAIFSCRLCDRPQPAFCRVSKQGRIWFVSTLSPLSRSLSSLDELLGILQRKYG
eukprot:g61997.t1